MNKRKSILLLLSIIIIIAASQIYGASSNAPDGLPAAKKINGDAFANIPPVSVAIKTFQERLKQNPDDPVTFTLLANQYIRQARETGDVSGYQRAEDALKEALALLPNYSFANTTLASIHYARHDFASALELAQAEYDRNPKNTQALVIVADSHLSLGNYQEAEAIYLQLNNLGATPPLLARLAALEELKGNPQEGLALMRRAAGGALESGGTKEGIAWYILRVADMYFNMGQYAQAGDYYAAALLVFDHYPLALAGLGKVNAAQGNYDEAIAYYQRAISIVPQPEYLAALGDLYMLTDQPAQAQLQYDTVEYIGKLAELNEKVYNRTLANFYSDHNMHREEALRLALAELEWRRDVYGYDAAAWAHYRNGNFKEAQTLMAQALSLGTRDASLYYHAGMIALALEDKAHAAEFLEMALSINPQFSILGAREARETLQALQQTAATK
jgi:tetratricopeptide (TPR) repeat protein